MHILTILVCFLVIINLVLTLIQQQQFEEARFVSEYALSERQTKSAIICVGHCLQIAECRAVRYKRSCGKCQLFSDVLWLYGSEIPPRDPDVVEYKMVNRLILLKSVRTTKYALLLCFVGEITRHQLTKQRNQLYYGMHLLKC